MMSIYKSIEDHKRLHQKAKKMLVGIGFTPMISDTLASILLVLRERSEAERADTLKIFSKISDPSFGGTTPKPIKLWTKKRRRT